MLVGHDPGSKILHLFNGPENNFSIQTAIQDGCISLVMISDVVPAGPKQPRRMSPVRDIEAHRSILRLGYTKVSAFIDGISKSIVGTALFYQSVWKARFCCSDLLYSLALLVIDSSVHPHVSPLVILSPVEQ